MATYRSIASSETDANSPIMQTLMEALAENPTAIAEGATGAPRHVLKSLEKLVAGDDIRSTNTVSGSVNQTVIHTFPFIQSGTVRCVMVKNSGGNNTLGRVDRSRNGSTTTVSTTTNLSTITVDVPVLPGDLITLFGGSLSTGWQITASLRVNDVNLWPGSAVLLSGNDV